MKFFGGGKSKTKAAPTAVQPKDALTRLRDTLEMLEKREKYLQVKIENELKVAKANAQKNKRVALMALKRKKQYEAELSKSSGARMTLETQMMTIENANVNLEALESMRVGSEAMKAIHGAMDINKVDDTMDSIREQMDLANEISEAISQPVGFGMDMDEDELNAELEDLEQEMLDSQLLETPAVPVASTSRPVAATAAPAASQPAAAAPVEEEDDAELEELRASMAL